MVKQLLNFLSYIFINHLYIYSTPDRYVEVGGSKLNEVSYQLVRVYCVPCRGVYVAEPSGSKFLFV